jgi:hypothetical protein
MGIHKDKEKLFRFSRREDDLRRKADRLEDMVNVLVHDKYELEAQYFNLKENFHVLANIKVRELADCLSEIPNDHTPKV